MSGHRALFLLALALIIALGASPAAAQPTSLLVPSGPQISNNQPVTFIADQITYDRETGVVTATGHVQAWQNGRVLEADRITYNRNTGIT
ncbi:MAG TPA: LptA/OstA family protein, partial [Acetobacteraceae bacterium]|nr:LptA/OstA family protein [Acetobacteraceae bacterium]